MTTLDVSIARSLDAGDPRLVPFLPALLADLDQLGTAPGVVVDGVRAVLGSRAAEARIVDLGCGKGIVSVALASQLPARCLGVDGLADFVSEARAVARRAGVEGRCAFLQGDLRDLPGVMPPFDAAILGAVGPAFGSFQDTCLALRALVREEGCVILDDAYVPDGSPQGETPGRRAALAAFRAAGLEVAREVVASEPELAAINEANNRAIRGRAEQLSRERPELAEVFAAYVRAQEEASRSLEKDLVCVTWVLRAK